MHLQNKAVTLTAHYRTYKKLKIMANEKNHIILTTKGGREFAVSSDCEPGKLEECAQLWREKLNAKYEGTEYEVVSHRLASEEEVKDFDPISENLA